MKTNPTAPEATDLQLQEAEHHRRVVRELVDAGMTIMRGIHEAAQAYADEPRGAHAVSLCDLATAYDVVAGAIRRSIVLAQRLGPPTEQARDERVGDDVLPQVGTLLN